jgi:sodium transport system permease protein
VERASIAVALALAQPPRDYPPLLEEQAGQLAFSRDYLEPRRGKTPPLLVRSLGPAPPAADFLAELDRSALDQRQVDLLLAVPPGFQAQLAAGGRPRLYVLDRARDDNSRLVNLRALGILNRWRKDLKEVRLVRHGLARDFDEPFEVYDPKKAQPARQQEELFTLLIRIFPFILVLWSLAGALYPAVDLCAGEKERGTMETLLISPASREEIVWGKFLTIWVFSAATALLNLLSMAFTTRNLGAAVPAAAFRPMALVWGVLLLLPLSAFFSAVCLAVGAYARSSKEGQYYLMPLFLVTMPLIFLTLAPGVELNPFYSMVPVTGVALLLQKLMAVDADHGRGPWLYFVPVLAPMVIYSWLALRWAIGQFNREEVLFREAERLDLALWLKRLLREKEPLPSAAEALFCFALILGLRWASFGVGGGLSLLARTGVSQVAFVATPPLLMALLLTTQPRHGLGLRRPPWWAWPAAVLLAALVLPPLAELTLAILRQFPALRAQLVLNHPLTQELRGLSQSSSALAGSYFLVLAVLPALCEELAFRGFILAGLRRGFRPHTAVLLSGFLFALYQMNVFQFLPHFVFGCVLALLVVRTGSVLPAMLFHLVYNTLLIAPTLLPDQFGALLELWVLAGGAELTAVSVLRLLLVFACAALAGVSLWVLGRQGRAPS